MEKIVLASTHNYRFLFFQSNNWTPLHHQMVIIYMPKTKKKIFIENYELYLNVRLLFFLYLVWESWLYIIFIF